MKLKAVEESAKRLTKGKKACREKSAEVIVNNTPCWKNLIKCGIDRWRAYRWGNTSKGYWRIAGSGILTRAIGDEALRKAGYSWIGCYYSASALPKG